MTQEIINDLKSKIRDVPDFPKPGVVFKDITPLLADAQAFRSALDLLGDRYQGQGVDVVVGVEARGFIVGSALAYKLGAGHVIIRKAVSSPLRPIGRSISWSTARTHWKSMRMPFTPGLESSSRMMSWRRGGPLQRLSTS